jgi:methylglyoxal synthase
VLSYAGLCGTIAKIFVGKSLIRKGVVMGSVITKRIAMVAHDNKKRELLAWANKHKNKLAAHELSATGTTGRLLSESLNQAVFCYKSGPLGGDQQIGAKISEGEIDMLIFFWDPLEAQPHDPDVKALLRLAAVWNIPVACNEATADFLVSSPLFDAQCHATAPDFSAYLQRVVKA